MSNNNTFDYYEDTIEGVLEEYSFQTEEERWNLELWRRERANEAEHNPLDPETMREMDAETMRRFDEEGWE